MVSVITLYVEILSDIVGLITGIIVLVRSSDNKLQRAGGCLTISLSLLLICDNLEWIWLFGKNVEKMPRFTEVPLDYLSLWHMVRTVIFFQFFSLFPIASLRPGWLSPTRVINLCIPVILIICIACCYELFNGHYTDIDSFSGIWENISHQDVVVRLVLFILSVIAPSANFLFPFSNRKLFLRRKYSKAMTIYIICYGMIMSGYIWLMLGTCGLSFNLFGLIVIAPTICLNLLYIRNENPLSLPPSPVEDLKTEELEAMKEIEVSPVVLELSNRLHALMKECAPFTDPQYSLKDLLENLGTNENRLNKVLHYNGFSGFRDYINFNRLQYFKEQSKYCRELTVKELMFKSGFTSRSSFYRYFASIEKCSPSEYLEMIGKENKENGGLQKTDA